MSVTHHGDVLHRITDVMQIMRASRDVVERLIHTHALQAIDCSPHAGRPRHRPMWRIRHTDLEAFLEGRETPAPPVPTSRRANRPNEGIVDFIG